MATTYRRALSCALLCTSTATPVLASGELDPGFGAGAGYRLVEVAAGAGSSGWLRAVQVDSAGRIVAAGFGSDAPDDDLDFRIARLDAAGNLDPGFGSGGLVNVGVGTGDNIPGTVLETAEGKYLVCGSADAATPSTTGGLAAVRLNANGTLDNSFDLDGRVLLQLQHPEDGVVTTAGGVGCATTPGGGVVLYGALFRASMAEASAVMARLHPDGSLDTTFGVGGVLVFDAGAGTPQLTAVSSAIVLADGTIVASGFTNVAPDTVQYDIFAARVLAGGSLDAGFGDDGLRMVAFDQGGGDVDVASGLAIAPDGDIVIPATIYTATDGYDMALVRLGADGDLDPAFGTGGRVRLGFNAGGDNNDELADLAIDSQGRLYLAGTVDVAINNTDAVVARLDASGNLDAGFAEGGWMVLGIDAPLASPREFLSGLTLDHSERVVAVGSGSSDSAISEGLVLRLTSDGIFGSGFEAMP